MDQTAAPNLERMPTTPAPPPAPEPRQAYEDWATAVKSPATSLPRRRRWVLAWIPIFWRRVLFPGAGEHTDFWRWQPLLILLLLTSVILYPFTSFHLFEPDEGRYAQIPREMLESGAWIVPTLQHEPYLDKPPLFYWAVMIAYALFGYHDWAARLVPALAVQLTILLNYLLGRRFVGERSAFCGALALALLPGLLGTGRLLLLDGMLTLFVTLSLYSAFLATAGPSLRWGWWVTTCAACALGVLTKGPIALVLLVAPLWIHGRLTRATHLVRPVAWALLGVVVLAVNLPWYVAVWRRLPEFGAYFFWQHNVLRFAQPFDHIEPVWYYLPVLFVGFFPAVLLAAPFLRFLFSAEPDVSRRRDPALGFLLLAGGWSVFFFTLSGCKLPTYVLPAFPPWCLALGVFLARTEWHRARVVRWGAAGMAAFILIGHAVLAPWVAWQRSPMNTPPEVIQWCRDPGVPIYCFSRNVDSMAFYLGRSDLRTYRSKEIGALVQALDAQPRAIVLFAHRNSLGALRHHLPPHLVIVKTRPLGLCDMAVVQRVPASR
jgi:4-amino-4-deoxy-L-arabinose transferase-like glycosyltransferase